MSKKPPPDGWGPKPPPGWYKPGKPRHPDNRWEKWLPVKPGKWRPWPPWKDENRVWNKRRTGLRQKPWNKVQRREKFWVPVATILNAGQNMNLATTGGPAYVFFWDPFVENTEGVASFNFTGRGFSRVKVHRIQGYLACHVPWGNEGDGFPLDTSPKDGPAVIDYVWMMVDKAADTHDAGSFPATSLNPSHYSSGDIFELLQRDDIMSWGTVDVPAVGHYRRTEATLADGAFAGQLMGPGRRARIPFPRIPKLGLNIPRGKALACIAAARELVTGPAGLGIDDALDQLVRTVVIEGTYRLLCS